MHLRMASLTFKASFGLPIAAVGCKRATLAVSAHSGPACLSMSAQTLVGPNVPLDMETQFPVDVAQRPWIWTVGAMGWEAPTAIVYIVFHFFNFFYIALIFATFFQFFSFFQFLSFSIFFLFFQFFSFSFFSVFFLFVCS